MRVGILGGGQLAQMMAQAGKSMDCSFTFLDPSPTACAFEWGDSICGAYDDPKLLKKLAQASDVVTFEFENVPHTSVEILSEHVKISPSSMSLEISQDRLKEKNTFRHLSIPTTKFAEVNGPDDLKHAISIVGLPSVLKTRSQGYDGKGQKVLQSKNDVESAWEELGAKPMILEEFIPFDREISIIAVRDQKDNIKYYDVCENEHEQGILKFTQNRQNDPMAEKAQGYAKKLLEHMKYVGVFTLELFQKDDDLFANEMAPRVHNSGHWTIEGAKTSQFENHLRAILNMPLGNIQSKNFSIMVNLIGTIPNLREIEKIRGAHVHVYGKEPRSRRKLGHVTFSNDKITDAKNVLERLRKMTFISL